MTRCLILFVVMLAQYAQRQPLTPAETLIDPTSLSAIRNATQMDDIPAVGDPEEPIKGTDAGAGEIAVVRGFGDSGAGKVIQTLRFLINVKKLAAPARTIRLATQDARLSENTRAAVWLKSSGTQAVGVARNFWSSANIADEVAEIMARHVDDNVRAGDPGAASFAPAIAMTTPTTYVYFGGKDAEFVAAATVYFLATLPNAGTEALLSHLLVGAHARLAEDGRKAVAMMGSQQRAGGDVLIMMGQAIEREQRRIRSVERFMPAPVDPVLKTRLADMERSITGLWTSMGITSSPFVPPAERIRGRGGDDRRVPSKVGNGPLPAIEMPSAFLALVGGPSTGDVRVSADAIAFELGNFIDGKRSISDVRDAVSAEFGVLPLASVVDYIERLAKAGAVTIK